MTDKPKDLGSIIRDAMRKGAVSTDREEAERLGLTGFADKMGIKLVEKDELTRREAEGEQQIIVCAPLGTETPYTDNCEGFCIECARPIIYRPIFTAEQPKVCMSCAFDMANKEG